MLRYVRRMGPFRRKHTSDGRVAELPDDAPARLAAVAASSIRTAYEHEVTYTPSDLDFVDQGLSDLAAAGDLPSRSTTIVAFGCLLGEIMVRNDHARWTRFGEAEARIAGFPFGVHLSNGRTMNVVSIAYKRAAGGPERSIAAIREMALSDNPPVTPR